jgi:hypothetical protein
VASGTFDRRRGRRRVSRAMIIEDVSTLTDNPITNVADVYIIQSRS